MMPTATACAWCLNTPPRHDRCTEDDTHVSSVDINWYAPLSGLPCDCSCRSQGALW